MGIYDSDIDSAFEDIKGSGTEIDVIRPIKTSFDPEKDIDTFTSGELSGAISASAVTLNLVSVVDGPFSSSGIVSIDNELIKYSDAATAGTLTILSDLSRGYSDTDAIIHADGSAVKRKFEFFETYGTFGSYRTRDIDGDNIMRGDKKILIPGKNADFEIDTECLIIAAGEEYQVVDSQVIAPDQASKILYTVQVR